MSDDELIDLVARIWVENNGDKIGFQLVERKIEERITELGGGE